MHVVVLGRLDRIIPQQQLILRESKREMIPLSLTQLVASL